MNGSVAWRVAAAQTALVAAASIALAIALPHSFFEDWGWAAGPGAWAVCALLTARIVGLPPASTLVGALLAGLVSLAAVLVGVHWLGAAIAIGLFALWCGRRAAAPPGRPAPA